MIDRYCSKQIDTLSLDIGLSIIISYSRENTPLFIIHQGKYSIIYYPLYILLFIRYAEIGGKISIDRLKIIHDSSRMRTERERERHFLYRLPGNFIVSMIFNGCMVLDNCYSNRIRMGIRTMLGIWNFGCILFSRIKRAQ